MADSQPMRRASRPVSQGVSRQACDKCRSRKVRCLVGSQSDGLGRALNDQPESCQRCMKMGLDCTFLLPQKTRGPRKRKVAIRSGENAIPSINEPTSEVGAVQECSNDPGSVGTTTDINDAGAETVADIGGVHEPYRSHAPPMHSSLSPVAYLHTSPHPSLRQVISPASPNLALGGIGPYTTDRLCDRSLINLILSDFLDRIYPLVPVVHRPSFRKDLALGRDIYDADFLALILALCAVTVSLLPSRFQQYQNFTQAACFQTRTETINHCYSMLCDLRGVDYFDQVNFPKWAASWLMTITFFQVGQQNRARMMEIEGMQLARLLEMHRISSYDGLNCIETQLRKKGFWLCFYGYVHGQVQNLRKEKLAYLDSLIADRINLHDLLPVEVEDELILENMILPHDDGKICTAMGYNLNSRTFWAALRSSTMSRVPLPTPEHCACIRRKQPRLQLEHLQERLYDLKYMLDGIPAQLSQWGSTCFDDVQGYQDGDDRQKAIIIAQYGAMRINIHVTHLWLQSMIMDQIDALQLSDTTVSAAPHDLKTSWKDREDICRQLLHVLHSASEAHVEPNGHHLTYKVRDVAVTLLACPFGDQEKESIRAYDYLRQFTALLSRLDGTESMNSSNLQSWIDTARQSNNHPT